jgi:hypothetical protein
VGDSAVFLNGSWQGWTYGTLGKSFGAPIIFNLCVADSILLAGCDYHTRNSQQFVFVMLE